MTQQVAIVLAGGRSARMGQDKALLPVGRGPLLHHTCSIAAESGARVYVVTPTPERYQTLLPDLVSLIQETPLEGQSETYHGPLVGLLQALDYLARQPPVPPWVLVLACDMPNLSPQVLQTWWEVVNQHPPQVMACLPHHQGRWEPLCGFYRSACRSSLRVYVQQGGRSFQGWLSQQSVAHLPLSDEAILVNLNSPEDFQGWQQQQARAKCHSASSGQTS